MMRKLTLQMQYSVDGFVAGPNGELDWIFPNFSDAVSAWLVQRLWQAGLHAMGSHTFHDMIAHWPTSTEPYAPPMNEIPKVVFSKKALDIGKIFANVSGANAAEGKALVPNAQSWADSAVASGDLTEEINRLKAEPGKDILAHGGASFAQSLARAGLVDEYHLVIHPVALGTGLPLFKDLANPIKLDLVSASTFDNGVAAHIYRPG
jgi:dihydrofolate reductase